MVLDYTAYDANASLDVAAKIYEVTTGTATHVTDVALTHVLNGSYFAQYVFDPTKEYLVSIAVYTSGAFTTLSGDYTPSAKSLQLGDGTLPAIKAVTDVFTFDGSAVIAKLSDGQINIKKGQTFSGFQFLMTDDTTHDPKTGLTAISTQVSIDGTAFQNTVNTAAEIGLGFYKIDIDSTETDCTMLTLVFSKAGTDTRSISIITQN